VIRVTLAGSFESFREKGRALLALGVAPDGVTFEEEGSTQQGFADLFAESQALPSGQGKVPRIPRKYVELAEEAACFRDPSRWAVLYRVLWRLAHGERGLLDLDIDEDIHRLKSMARQVHREVHKLHAFVRFRRVERDGEEHFIAWYRPEHPVLPRAAPFFAERFGAMRWSILTPDGSAHWDLSELSFGPGVPRSEAPAGDELEALWKRYYASVFNPARLNLRAMRAEMPSRYWATMPETALIPELIRQAPGRTGAMLRPSSAPPSAASAFLPERRELSDLREAARRCTACELHERATQTVFGEGPAHARLMLVGEQPGDFEDQQGRPFVGPAGQLLDRALAAVGIDRTEVYVTNAVKHFNFREEGKQRLHAKPGGRAIRACNAWIQAELEAVAPRLIVCLGATAAQAFLGPTFRLTRSRGQVFETPWAPAWMATYHPSALLRMPDEAARAQAERDFLEDLRRAAGLLAGADAPANR
jgi:DNA polymerase